MSLEQIQSRIKRRRAQMLIHSCIYYHYNDSIINDHLWQEWANELRDLQNKHGHSIGFYDEAFKDWNGDTGAMLPLKEDWVLSRAQHLMRIHETNCD